MGRNKKTKIFFSILLLLFLGASFVLAAENVYPDISGNKFPTQGSITQYLKYIFNFAIILGGLLAFGSLIYGGFLYVTSFGSPTRMGKAKDRIFGSILGLLILLSSYMILFNINPALVIWAPPDLKDVGEIKKPVIIPAPLGATCDPIPTFETDILAAAESEIAMINKIMELSEESGKIFQVLDPLVNIIKECNCVFSGTEKCLVPASNVAGLTEICLYCNQPEKMCPGLKQKIEELRNKIKEREQFLAGFDEELEKFKKSEEIEKFEATLKKTENCHLDQDQHFYICQQAKFLKLKSTQECQGLDFYCCY